MRRLYANRAVTRLCSPYRSWPEGSAVGLHRGGQPADPLFGPARPGPARHGTARPGSLPHVIWYFTADQGVGGPGRLHPRKLDGNIPTPTPPPSPPRGYLSQTPLFPASGPGGIHGVLPFRGGREELSAAFAELAHRDCPTWRHGSLLTRGRQLVKVPDQAGLRGCAAFLKLKMRF